MLAGFEIAVNDAALVRRLEAVAELRRYRQRLGGRQRARRQAIGQRRALDQLHRDDRSAVAGFDAEDLGDVGMIERREHLCLALESTETAGIAGARREQDLEGDVALQADVAGAEHFSHPAGAEPADDLVSADSRTRGQRHDDRSVQRRAGPRRASQVGRDRRY